MSRQKKLMRLTAFLLSFLLLLPVVPVFAEPSNNVEPEGLLFDYDVVYDGPFNYEVGFFDNVVINLDAVGKIKGKPMPFMPPPQWVPIGDPLFLEWSVKTPSQLSAIGASFDGSKITIPTSANAGTLVMKASIKMPIPMTQMFMTVYSEEFTFNITKRIPIISFVNGPSDFNLWVPEHDGTIDIDYTAVVKDQNNNIIPELTAKVRMQAASSQHVHDYYNETTNHLALHGQPGYSGTIDLEAYIEEFDEMNNTALSLAAPTPIPAPVHSVEATITINREEDTPDYGILKGKERIAIPRTGEVKEVYNYEIYSQYDVLLEDVGYLGDFYFPVNQPATIEVDEEEQTIEVTVKSTAPHSYLILKARLYDEEFIEDASDEPEEPALKELWFGWERYTQMYIYLDKAVYGTIDDANNVVILDNEVVPSDGPSNPEEPIEQAIYENLQYRIADYYPDESMDAEGNDYGWSEGWRDYNPEDPPIFPGKMDVEFRYKNNYSWRPMVPVDLDIECRPRAYNPGAITEYNFTVLKPSIGANPANPLVGASSTVTITYNELYPGFELVPADMESDLFWYDPDHFPYIALKSMWYKIGETGEWQRYENPFTVSTSTTIFAKTVVFLDLMMSQLKGSTDLPEYHNYSGDYTSPLASIAINFQQPTTQPPTQPETQAPTQPETQGPTQPETTQTVAPVETTTVAVVPVTVAIEEVTVPQGALEESTAVQAAGSDLVFNEVVTPLGDATLPETNELPITLLYGMGVLLGGVGVYLVKRKED